MKYSESLNRDEQRICLDSCRGSIESLVKKRSKLVRELELGSTPHSVKLVLTVQGLFIRPPRGEEINRTPGEGALAVDLDQIIKDFDLDHRALEEWAVRL